MLTKYKASCKPSGLEGAGNVLVCSVQDPDYNSQVRPATELQYDPSLAVMSLRRTGNNTLSDQSLL